MRLNPKTDNIDERVNTLVESLKLNKAVDTKIGGPLIKGVSGGERKRTSIGVELITDPSLIFLDEPTTGLDSFTSEILVNILKELSQSGRTVITTIHQPNSDIFQNFDQLLLMAKGKIIYHNKSSLAVKYFAKIGYECPPRTNPADYFMNMMSIEAMNDVDTENPEELIRSMTAMKEDYDAKIQMFSEKYEESELKNNADELSPDVFPLSEDTSFKYYPSYFVQFWYVFIRNFKNTIRIPVSSYVKIFANIIIALMTILVFGSLETDTQSIQSRNGLLMFV